MLASMAWSGIGWASFFLFHSSISLFLIVRDALLFCIHEDYMTFFSLGSYSSLVRGWFFLSVMLKRSSSFRWGINQSQAYRTAKNLTHHPPTGRVFSSLTLYAKYLYNLYPALPNPTLEVKQ